MKRYWVISATVICLILVAAILMLVAGTGYFGERGFLSIRNGGEQAIKIGALLPRNSDPHIQILIKRIRTTFLQSHPDWELYIMDTEDDVNYELTCTKELIADGCDIILILAVDSYGSSASVLACNEAGVPCIAMENSIAYGEKTYITYSNYDCGRKLAEYFRDKLVPNASICFILGTVGSQNSIDRVEGFMDALNRDDIIIIDKQCGDWLSEKGEAITRNWLKKHDRIDAIISCCDCMTTGAIQALKEAGRLDRVLIGSVDGDYSGLLALKNGEIECDMFFNTWETAKCAMDACERILNGETKMEDYIISAELITPEMVQDVLDTHYSDYTLAQ